MMPKLDLKNVAKLSIAVLLAQVLLIKTVYTWLGTATQTMFSISTTTLGGTQVGDKVIGYLSGFTDFQLTDITVWASMFIGVFAVIALGFLVYDNKFIKVWNGRNLSQRIFAILLYGTVILYGALYLLKMDVPGIAGNLLIGLAINLVAVSALVTLSASKLNFPRV